MSEQATTEICAPGQTTEHHEMLEPFVGTWKATVRMWMGPGEPMVSTGIMKNTLVLGGRFLKHDYKGDPCEGPFPNFEGGGYFGYNTGKRKYEGFWIDNASTMMQTEEGDLDKSGKVWTMIGKFVNPENGQPMSKRTLITLTGKDAHTMETWMQGPDGNEFKCMEIEYVRK